MYKNMDGLLDTLKHSKSLNKINKCMYAKCVSHVLFITDMFDDGSMGNE
jgi:hypothetical protein